MHLFARIFLLFLLLGTAVQADQQGIVVRQAMVYADASSASAQVGNISAGTRVSIFERRGGWQEIFSEERSMIGWVRSYQVRASTASSQVITEQKEDSRGFLSGLAAFSRKASGFFTQDSKATSSGTATIGVRGLSESEINSAQADFDELEKMKKYASNRKRMTSFVEAGGLKANKVAHIPQAGK
jgi:uncharacterized protein YraI